MNEMPTINSVNYGNAAAPVFNPYRESAMREFYRHADSQQLGHQVAPKVIRNKVEETGMSEDRKRLVRVLIVDPHPAVPADDALLYDSKEQFTDKTDQELFFEAPIHELLKEHNEKRVLIADKEIKDRTEHLEEARIRDLNVVVVTVAEFS